MTIAAIEKHRKRFQEGETLLVEGDVGEDFFLLEKGKLDVLIQGRKIDTIEAKEGQEFVGEVAALLGQPRTATIVAATDCRVVVFPKLEIEAVLSKAPSLGVKLARSLCRKLKGSADAHADFQKQRAAIINTESTDVSVRNYMKGILHMIEESEKDPLGHAATDLVEYFRKTNPWGLRKGNSHSLLDV